MCTVKQEKLIFVCVWVCMKRLKRGGASAFSLLASAHEDELIQK